MVQSIPRQPAVPVRLELVYLMAMVASVARRGQHTDAVAAFRQVVNDAHRRGQLTAEQRLDLLREA